jgi:copper homeostasis protein CutC
MFRVRDGKYVFNGEDNVKKAFLDTIRNFAQFGADIVVTGVFATRRSIEEALKACRRHKVVSVIHCANDFGTTHEVPEDVIRSMWESWEEWGIDSPKGFTSLEKVVFQRRIYEH